MDGTLQMDRAPAADWPGPSPAPVQSAHDLTKGKLVRRVRTRRSAGPARAAGCDRSRPALRGTRSPRVASEACIPSLEKLPERITCRRQISVCALDGAPVEA